MCIKGRSQLRVLDDATMCIKRYLVHSFQLLARATHKWLPVFFPPLHHRLFVHGVFTCLHVAMMFKVAMHAPRLSEKRNQCGPLLLRMEWDRVRWSLVDNGSVRSRDYEGPTQVSRTSTEQKNHTHPKKERTHTDP